MKRRRRGDPVHVRSRACSFAGFSAFQMSGGAGLLAAYITEAVRGKNLVLLAESVVEANIEGVLVVDVVLICQIILG